MAKRRDHENANNIKQQCKREKRPMQEKSLPKLDVPSSVEVSESNIEEEQIPFCEETTIKQEETAVKVESNCSEDDTDCVDIESAIIKSESFSSVPGTPTPNNDEKSKNTSRSSTTPSASRAGSTVNLSIPRKRKGRRGSGTSSDEERWLTAIEAGKLEDVDDELKKIKNPKLMTARQRAMYERNMDMEPSAGGELLMSLPTGYKEKPQTAEAIQKAALKTQKRKQQADEKREKDKKKTIERLLKKQETKQRSTGRLKIVKTVQPMISYRNTLNGSTLSFPIDFGVPIEAQPARDPPKPQLCGIAGCSNLKVYNCSKTKLPLCSFACYRKNVQAIRQMMC